LGSPRRTIEWTIGVSLLALVIGVAITIEHGADAKLAQRLKTSGRSTQATITKKQASAEDGRGVCYFTYQFRARQASAPNAPFATFSREVEVPDGFFDLGHRRSDDCRAVRSRRTFRFHGRSTDTTPAQPNLAGMGLGGRHGSSRRDVAVELRGAVPTVSREWLAAFWVAVMFLMG
jgi:hypothetical protein